MLMWAAMGDQLKAFAKWVETRSMSLKSLGRREERMNKTSIPNHSQSPLAGLVSRDPYLSNAYVCALEVLDAAGVRIAS